MLPGDLAPRSLSTLSKVILYSYIIFLIAAVKPAKLMMEKTVKKAEFTYILLPRIHLYVCVAVCGKAALVELGVAFEISHSALHKTLYFEHFSLSPAAKC